MELPNVLRMALRCFSRLGKRAETADSSGGVAQPPQEAEGAVVNKIETFLSKAGNEIKKIASYAVKKVLPVATGVAVKAEPVEDLVLTSVGLGSYVTEFNTVAESCLTVEQAAAVLPSGMTGEAKFAAVLASVESTLLPKLDATGLTTEEANAKLKEYIEAVVTVLNTFEASSTATTTASTTAA